MLPAALPWDFIVILIVLAIVVPWRGAVRVRALMRRDALTSVDRIALYASTIAFQWLATGIILWRAVAHGYRLADLGLSLPSPWLAAVVGVGLSASDQLQSSSEHPPAGLAPERQTRLHARAHAEADAAQRA